MAVYKVPQDVEADDKLIGPFSFRQFLFLLIMVGFLYFGYLMFTINIVLVIIPLPFVVFFAALAFPWRKDQPTEVYLTALIHFWTKPRKRIWDQEGHMEHVHITVPKKEEHKYTDGLSNNEVQSRLHSLASTLDTRGWASKNVDIPEGDANVMNPQQVQQSDRLVMPKVVEPVQAPGMNITAEEDVMDVANNPVAQNFNDLVNKQAEDHRAQLMQQMQQPTPTPSTPASNDDQPAKTPDFNPYPQMQQTVVSPSSSNTEIPQENTPQPSQDQAVNPDAQNAIINLANNSDLNVSTIARQADEAMHSGDTIELH